jgi:tRNA threonylcarbamoyl adenosine modification protein (Sua5/YciO/YrdC/YwlC family)
MYLRVHPINPEERKINQICDCLKNSGVIIYPTDTMYGIGCSILNTKAIERLYKIKGVNEKTAQFSFICKDISDLSQYAKSIETTLFRILKKALPGPYTFIMEASKEVPKLLKTKKNTVGLRIPQNIICQTIIETLGHPIISTSLPAHAELEHYIDPEVFYEDFENKVDLVIDGGLGTIDASSVIDVTQWPEYKIIREGIGNINIFE